MARIVNVFEPWTAKASTTWATSFAFPPAVDDPDVLAQWEAARERARQNAEWHIWGSGMWTPTPVLSLMGEARVHDDRGILATFRPYHTERENPPDHGLIARRAAACVSACAGIINPVDTIERVRTLLSEMLQGTATADDPRVLACVARLMKPEPDAQHPGCCEGDP